MNRLSSIFIQGLLTLLPLALSVYILTAAVSILENFLGIYLREILTEKYYIPGLGLIASLIMIFVFGLLVNYYVTQKFLLLFEKRLLRIPFFKSIYSPLKDLMNLFSKKGDQAMQKVVLVQLNPHIRALGLVTRENFDSLGLHEKATTEKLIEKSVAVYIPMSYGLGGYTLLIAASQLTPLDWPVEKAMTMALTGWLQTQTPKENVKDL